MKAKQKKNQQNEETHSEREHEYNPANEFRTQHHFSQHSKLSLVNCDDAYKHTLMRFNSV